MTLASMTGFARTQGSTGDIQWAWEIRSVNGRGLDLRLRLPNGFEALDQPVRKLASGALARGNVSINLQVQWTRTQTSYRINEEWLAALQSRAAQMISKGNATTFDKIRPDGLLGLRGVIETADETSSTAPLETETHAALLAGAENAVMALLQARAEEGRSLASILTSHMDQIEALTAAARDTGAAQPATIRSRLVRAISDVASETPALPEDRLANEIALLAAKADVREELDRLEAHIAAGRALMDKGDPCGRKLEFLAQEFHREANTLCSKSQDVELTRIGLDLKTAIDQVREQVANVE